MAVFAWIIGILWAAFIAFWFISALGAKRNASGVNWWRGIYIRLAFVVIVVFLLHFQITDTALRDFENYGLISLDPVVRSIGVILCAAGIAFALWARIYLGRNWGMPMSLKEDPELVTGGPYAYVRHPIYAGFILAILGSVLTDGIWWLLPLLVSCLYFIYSASTEEKIMTEQFPDQYPEYKKRTKMLIPFVF